MGESDPRGQRKTAVKRIRSRADIPYHPLREHPTPSESTSLSAVSFPRSGLVHYMSCDSHFVRRNRPIRSHKRTGHTFRQALAPVVEGRDEAFHRMLTCRGPCSLSPGPGTDLPSMGSSTSFLSWM